ncbi:hypothetical protein [Rummeliibacillus suwonensis]|uniref:hypothetical protein n=1 Tax=Rummeliibacillus suwonensis TaxID=1306154 RepID=UPI0011B39B2E|nr:hypothetical protein [Rummeliibacillus suwonensis]
MKKIKIILSMAMALTIFSFFDLTNASAASGWQKLGTWDMAYVIRIYSADGGNLKVCVKGTDKVKFGLERAPIWPNPVEKTTSGKSGDNCATWSDLSSNTSYDLNKVNYRGTIHTVTVWD